MEIKKGQRFYCKEDVVMSNGEHKITYIKGNYYISEKDNCITNEQGDKLHRWSSPHELSKYFELVTETPKFEPYYNTDMVDKMIEDFEKGIKEEDGKTDYSEINLYILDIMAQRMAENKHKYPKGNSKNPIKINKLEWAMFRHIKKIVQPLDDDKESYMDHLAAIACNVSMILDQLNLENENS